MFCRPSGRDWWGLQLDWIWTRGVNRLLKANSPMSFETKPILHLSLVSLLSAGQWGTTGFANGDRKLKTRERGLMRIYVWISLCQQPLVLDSPSNIPSLSVDREASRKCVHYMTKRFPSCVSPPFHCWYFCGSRPERAFWNGNIYCVKPLETLKRKGRDASCSHTKTVCVKSLRLAKEHEVMHQMILPADDQCSKLIFDV